MSISLPAINIGSIGWGGTLNGYLQTIQDAISVACCYRTAAGQTLNTTLTVIDFGTSYFDTNSAVTTGSSWRFQAPTAGKYQVQLQIMTSATASGVMCTLEIQTSPDNSAWTNQFESETRWDDTAGSYARVATLAGIVSLSANYYVRARMKINSGSKTLVTTAERNFINIAKVAV